MHFTCTSGYNHSVLSGKNNPREIQRGPPPVFASPDCKHNTFALSGGNTYAENGRSSFSFLRPLRLAPGWVMRDALREQSALSAAYMRGVFGRRNDDRPGEARGSRNLPESFRIHGLNQSIVQGAGRISLGNSRQSGSGWQARAGNRPVRRDLSG